MSWKPGEHNLSTTKAGQDSGGRNILQLLEKQSGGTLDLNGASRMLAAQLGWELSEPVISIKERGMICHEQCEMRAQRWGWRGEQGSFWKPSYGRAIFRSSKLVIYMHFLSPSAGEEQKGTIQSINKGAVTDSKIIKCQSGKVSMKSSGPAITSKVHLLR